MILGWSIQWSGYPNGHEAKSRRFIQIRIKFRVVWFCVSFHLVSLGIKLRFDQVGWSISH